MSSLPRVILVTGANRGIGLAIIQSLATRPETAHSILLMGCRDTSKGEAAISGMQSSSPQINASNIRPVEVDVTSDRSIRNAVAAVQSQYGHLDALVNNAGCALAAKAEDHSDVRSSFSDTFNMNITSVYMTTTLFLPLLRKSPSKNPKVINVSSARASMTRVLTGQLPPTIVVSYGVSKTALNALTLEMSRASENEGVEFQLVNPGHCKTAFNGYRGARDPLEGADVVTELVIGDRRHFGFWETIGSDKVLKEVPL